MDTTGGSDRLRLHASRVQRLPGPTCTRSVGVRIARTARNRHARNPAAARAGPRRLRAVARRRLPRRRGPAATSSASSVARACAASPSRACAPAPPSRRWTGDGLAAHRPPDEAAPSSCRAPRCVACWSPGVSSGPPSAGSRKPDPDFTLGRATRPALMAGNRTLARVRGLSAIGDRPEVSLQCDTRLTGRPILFDVTTT